MEPANGADGTISNLAMPRLSPAFKRLEERLAEVSHLHLVARKYAQMKKIIKHKDQVAHTNALVRSATVLLSSHIQGYVEDLSDIVIEHLIADDVDAVLVPEALRYHATKSAIKEIRDASDPAATIQKLRSYLDDYGEILRKDGLVSPSLAGSEYKNGFGNPTVGEIKKFLSIFGLNDFNAQMGKRLKGDWPIVENAVNQIVDRRNKIAHGDVLATLTVRELSEYLKLARKFASNVDRVVTSHFSSKGCKFWA